MAWQTFFRKLWHRRAADRERAEEFEGYAAEMNRRRAHSVHTEAVAWDLRYAARMLRKSPALTLACVLTFALGVGANTTIFSMVNALMLRTLPVPHPEQLYQAGPILSNDPSWPVITGADVRSFAAQTESSFSAVTQATMDTLAVRTRGRTRSVFGGYVDGNFFATMGVRPALGRFFSADAAPEAVLSYGYWRSQFGGNPGVVGGTATINGHAATIVGVTPAGFHGISNLIGMQVFVPFALAPAGRPEVVRVPLLRLRPGANRATAEAQLAVWAHRLAAEHPAADKGLRLRMTSMATGMVNTSGGNPFGAVGALFLALAGLVLLLAAANLTGVLLARSRTRQREMAVRAALGAGRGRLARQAFFETVLLAVAGGAVGMGLGIFASRALSALPPATTLPVLVDFRFDWHVFAYGCLMALAMALIAGLLPAWRAAGADPNQALHDGAAGATSRRQRLRSVLVTAQVAGSLALLIVGGLFVRSLAHAQNRPLGFEPAHLWDFVLDTSGSGYTSTQAEQFFDQLLPAVRALPGVQAASLAREYPFGTESWEDRVSAAGEASRTAPDVTINTVSPEFFSTLGIPLLSGRGLTASDNATAPGVVVVSARLARKLWPGGDPIGRQVVQAGAPRHPLTVVGVAGDAIYNMSDPTAPQMYLALAQAPEARRVLQVRTAAGATTPVPAVESLLQRMAPQVPVGEVQAMSASILGLNGLYLFHLGARLATALGLLGLFLAMVGVYGVVAYTAAQRTREIGIRVALGARPRQVLAAILRQALAVVGVGVVLGLVAAAAIGKAAGAFLVGVSGLDPLTFGAATALLVGVALAAALVPAVRASRADPLAALRCE